MQVGYEKIAILDPYLALIIIIIIIIIKLL